MKEKCHFIGIGGIGMSGLARILLAKNGQVSGSDVAANQMTDQLAERGAKISIGHAASNVAPNSTVIFNSNIRETNPEYQAALENNCRLLHRSDLLKELMSGYKTLSVTGTHGKTTTTSLLTSVLLEANLDPSFAIGGFLPQLNTNADYGKGPYFVAEADESDGTFLKYHSHGAIVTNIDLDHLDHFKSEKGLVDAFKTFLNNVENPSLLFWCQDDFRLEALKPPGISYGFDASSHLKGSKFRQTGWTITFDASFEGNFYRNIEVSLTGYHNALNALAVFGLCLKVGIDEAVIRNAFKKFQGIMRRCEKKGESHGILFLDDYAHHPTEIKATLMAIRRAVPERRIVAVYQPHRYSRTKDTLGHFAHVFDDADLIVITDIYAASEAPIPGVSHENLVREIQKTTRIPCKTILRSDLTEKLTPFLRPHDVVVSIGAGDITKLSSQMLEYFKLKSPPKYQVGVVFGGRSVEHEVSLQSAKHIMDSLKPEFYEQIHFGITRDGYWFSGKESMDAIKSVLKDPKSKKPAQLISPEVLQDLFKCDILFTVLHGTYGEDGMIQGFYEMLDKAYVGCDYRSGAVCMDKALTKTLMQQHGIPTLPFVSFSFSEWQRQKQEKLDEIEKSIHYPVFIKPVHLGSSVGISKATTRSMLEKAIDLAFNYDTIVMVEKGLKIREIEFAVLGNDDIQVFRPGEICTGGEIYTYEAKYGENAMKVAMVEDLSEEQIRKGMDIAGRAYLAAGCLGMARVDTFYDSEGNFWLNEINPIPGFTKNSAYPWICRQNGLGSEDLMDRLIILGLQRKRQVSLKEI